jgi:hypothetical protein
VRTALALVVALALVGGALYVRAEVIIGGADVADAGGDAVGGAVIACDEALGDGCPGGSQRLALEVMAAELEADPGAYDVVLAPSVVVDLLAASPTGRVDFGSPVPVASTTAVLVVHRSRASSFEASCVEVTWACIGDLVRSGELTPGFTDPSRSSEGLVALAALAGGHLGRTDYPSNAFREPTFLTWLDGVAGTAEIRPDPVASIVQFNGAQNDSAITFEATGGLRAGSIDGGPAVFVPTPIAAVEVVAIGLGAIDEAIVEEAAEAARTSLAGSGWREPDGAAPDGTADDQLPAPDDGLPSGAVLFSLRETW